MIRHALESYSNHGFKKINGQEALLFEDLVFPNDNYEKNKNDAQHVRFVKKIWNVLRSCLRS